MNYPSNISTKRKSKILNIANEMPANLTSPSQGKIELNLQN